MNPATVMVTGAGGFLGRAIVRSLCHQGFRVVACPSPNTASEACDGHLVCRLRLPNPRLARLVAAERPDWLIHCAGTSSVLSSVHDPAQDWYQNVGVTQFVYDILGEHSPQTRVIFLSSAAVYGQPMDLPVTERTPCAPISPYGHHKLACEQLGAERRQRDGLRVTNLRIFSAYGMGLRRQVLWDIYQKAMRSPTVVLDGDGSETRDFVHVRDVTRVIQFLLTSQGEPVELLNVASGTSITIARLAETFLGHLGLSRRLRFSGVLGTGVPSRWTVDTSPLQRYGLSASVSMSEGLGEYARWLQQLGGEVYAGRTLAAAG